MNPITVVSKEIQFKDKKNELIKLFYKDTQGKLEGKLYIKNLQL